MTDEGRTILSTRLTLDGHSSDVMCVMFSPDGKRLGTANSGGIVQIYALDPQELFELAHSGVTRHRCMLTPVECRCYFQSETCPPLA
jgi:WD40 repeat protein